MQAITTTVWMLPKAMNQIENNLSLYYVYMYIYCTSLYTDDLYF